MCGIYGIRNISDKEPLVSKDYVIKMRDTMVHRGPDDAGVYVAKDSKVGLGHRRLSIIDLSPQAKQPMCNENGAIWVVSNGEIYNFQELRRDLEKKGHKFRSHSDTEVIIHLYEEYGDECVTHLRGMFAFGLWDENNQRLLLARDRVGIKPLCYYYDGKKLIFASEMKAIVADRSIKRELDYAALSDYFTYLYIPAPKTIFKNINKLLPGHILTFEKGNLNINKYWDLTYSIDESLSENEHAEKLLEVLKDSLNIHMVSDVPLGAFLSGGLDSSTVVALMTQLLGRPIKSFSIGFMEETFNELGYAKLVAEMYNCDRFEEIIQPDALEVFEKLIYQFDEPYADSSALPTYFVSKVARKNVTVCISGDGGDEVFAGYKKYHSWLRLAPLFRIPLQIRAPISKGIYNCLPDGFRGKGIAHSLSMPFLDYFLRESSNYTIQESNMLLTEDVKKKIGSHDPHLHLKNYFLNGGSDLLSKFQYVDIKTYLPDDILTKVDKTSMLCSLEARVPFLDHKVLETAATIPARFRLKGGDEKYILKKAMKNLLPKEILKRPKMGFNVPLNHWFSNSLEEFTREILLSKKARERGIMETSFIEQMLNIKGMPKISFYRKLWSLVCFEKWCEIYLD